MKQVLIVFKDENGKWAASDTNSGCQEIFCTDADGNARGKTRKEVMEWCRKNGYEPITEREFNAKV